MSDLHDRLKAGELPELVMRDALGEELARRLVDAARRVRLRDVGGADRDAQGRPVRGTARADFGHEPERPADSPVVVRACRLVLHLSAWMSTRGDARTGIAGQGSRLAIGWLERWLGTERRNLSRYLAVLRCARVIESWQPPQGSGMPRGTNTGHCFAVYRYVQGLPSALRARLERWRERHAPRVARELTGPQQGPSTLAQGFAPPAAIAALLAAHLDPLKQP